MSVSNLPTEILLKIFENLSEYELDKCQRVSLLWKNVADVHIESIYKEYCKKDHGDVYDEAYGKSKLKWRELYHSPHLWSSIQSAKVADRYECEDTEPFNNIFDRDNIRQFVILKNGVISYAFYKGPDECKARMGYLNTIVYYDSATLTEINRVSFDFLFDASKENEDLIVLRGQKLQMYVFLKTNKRIFYIGEALQHEWGDYSRFDLVGNNVYFQTEDHTLWVSKPVEENGETTVKTEPLIQFTNDILAVSCISDKHINILGRSLCDRLHIFTLIGKNLEYVCKVDKSVHHNVVINLLKQYGFDWSEQPIYQALTRYCANDMEKLAIINLKEATVFKYGKLIFAGTSRRVLHVYYNPYNKGQLKLMYKKPSVKYDLNELFPIHEDEDSMPPPYKKIDQIGVIEIENGHRIVILYCQKLIILELKHNMVLKRVSEASTSGSTNQKVLKLA